MTNSDLVAGVAIGAIASGAIVYEFATRRRADVEVFVQDPSVIEPIE